MQFQNHIFESKNIAELILLSETRGDVVARDKTVLTALNRWIAYTGGLIIALGCFPVAPSVSAKNPPMIERKARSTTLSSSAVPLTRRADFLREHGEIEEALPLYTEAIKIDSRASQAYIGRALVWEEFGKTDKALADLTAAFKLGSPFNQTAARCRGDLYQSLHRYNEAIEDYTRVISAAPTDGLYFSRGSCYLRVNKPALAVKDFDKALSIGHKRSSVYVRRGDAYYALKQDKKALADYDMTLKLDPEGNEAKDGHEHLHKCKAEIYKRMGKMNLYKKELAASSAGRNANIDLAPFASDPIK